MICLLPSVNRIHHGKYHPFPSMIGINIDNILAFPPTQNLFLFCVIPWVPCYPNYVMFYLEVLLSFMSRMLWGLLHLLRILGVVILLTSTILSWSPCCLTRNIDKWTMLLGLCNSSNPVALKLMVGRPFLDHRLSNHHSNINRAIEPIIRVQLSTNV